MIREVESGMCRGVAGPEEGVSAGPVSAGNAAPEGSSSFHDVLVRMRESEREADAWLSRAMGRGMADPEELLRLQVVVHRFQYQVELASRVVDQVSQAVRTLTRPS